MNTHIISFLMLIKKKMTLSIRNPQDHQYRVPLWQTLPHFLEGTVNRKPYKSVFRHVLCANKAYNETQISFSYIVSFHQHSVNFASSMHHA